MDMHRHITGPFHVMSIAKFKLEVPEKLKVNATEWLIVMEDTRDDLLLL